MSLTLATAINFPGGRAVLATGVNNSATSWVLESGGGTALALGGATYRVLRVYEAPLSGLPEDVTAVEYIRCSAISTDTLTVARAQQGSSAQSWSAGAIVESVLTAADIDDLKTLLNDIETRTVLGTAGVVATTGTFGGGYAGGSGATAAADGSFSMNGAFQCDGAARVNGLLRPWTVWIPATIFKIIGGSPTLATWTGASSAKQDAWFLDASAVEELGCVVAMPTGYAGQSVTVEIFWTGDSAGSGVVRWITRGNVVADGGSLALAFNADVEDTYQGADLAHIISVAATESTGRVMMLGIGRRGDHVNDTLAQDAIFLGAFISIL